MTFMRGRLWKPTASGRYEMAFEITHPNGSPESEPPSIDVGDIIESTYGGTTVYQMHMADGTLVSVSPDRLSTPTSTSEVGQ
jgi:hypothetical protein